MLKVTAEEVGAGQELAPCEATERSDPSMRGGEPPRATSARSALLKARAYAHRNLSFGNTKVPAPARRSPHPRPAPRARAQRPGQVREPPAAGVEKPQRRGRVRRSRRPPASREGPRSALWAGHTSARARRHWPDGPGVCGRGRGRAARAELEPAKRSGAAAAGIICRLGISCAMALRGGFVRLFLKRADAGLRPPRRAHSVALVGAPLSRGQVGV